jgi:hypothetical protein
MTADMPPGMPGGAQGAPPMPGMGGNTPASPFPQNNNYKKDPRLKPFEASPDWEMPQGSPLMEQLETMGM